MPALPTILPRAAATADNAQPAALAPERPPTSMRPALLQDSLQMLACPSCHGLNPHFLGVCLHCGRMLPEPQERSHFRIWLQTFSMTTALLCLAWAIS